MQFTQLRLFGQLPVPIECELKSAIAEAAKIQDEQQIDRLVYSAYRLTDEEIFYIEEKNT